MKYVLLLSFEYYRYQHDAIVRIYADDRLVDELSLSSDINLKTTADGFVVGQYAPVAGPRNNTIVMFVPKKLFLFEIDERHLHKRIRIEVQNQHNNYTNGFMTKFSYLKFREILLFPSCLLEHKRWQRILDRLDGWVSDEDRHDRLFPHQPLADEITLQPDTRQKKGHWVQHILGGSFSMDIPLSRKHGLVHPGRLRAGKLELHKGLARVLWTFGQLNMST
jgi:hypothetical protein